jgi:hypothetical protein
MYSVSSTYRTKISETTRSTRLRGQITLGATTITLSGEDILPGSVEWKNQCIDKDDFNLGSVFAATVKLSIFDRVSTLDLKGGVVTLEFGLKLSDTLIEYVPLGVFNIIDAYHKLSAIVITGIDNMVKLDKTLPGIVQGTPIEILDSMTADTGVLVENTSFALHPNGSDSLQVTPGETMKTWRDMLMWLSQYLGSFATINRAGKAWIRELVSTSVETIGPAIRFKSPLVKDEPVTITSLSAMFTSTLYEFNISIIPNTGKNYKFDDNPLFWEYDDAQSGVCLENILSVLSTVNYLPGEVEFNGNPALDVGDYVTLSGTSKGTVVFRITSFTWKSKGKCIIRSAGLSSLLSTKQDLAYRQGSSRAQVQIDKLNGQIDLLAEGVSIIAADVDDLNGSRTELETKIDGVTITVTQQVDKISDLQSSTDENSAAIDSNADAIALQKSYFNYDGAVTMGRNDSPAQIRMEIDTDSKPKVTLTDGFNETVTIKSNAIKTPNVEITETMIIGNHKVQKVTGSTTETIFFPI